MLVAAVGVPPDVLIDPDHRHLSGSWVNVRVVAVRRAALFPAMPALSIFVGDPAG
ncbi:hypothetical protein MSAR_06060 [Mycolicibacterium sarraceniae]|uniref:Uncharacterized protein n=1 Tax=Mycolicibacterium sarraceniae TaxID=1534348 RepID=A0A7I7SLS6_9MYCO|nr:hypothetical protein MSAR_06060 [Mycolicibacterium sarraceniae]